LVISGGSSVPITNKNLTYREAGTHELELKGYSESDDGSLTVRIRYDNLVYLDTTFSLSNELESYSAQFDVSEPLPPFDELILLVRSGSGADVHLDDIYLRNTIRRDESILPCQSSGSLQSNVPLNQLQNKGLTSLIDQNQVGCGALSGSALQLWQHFMPDEASGIIGVSINQFDPIIEVYSECSYSNDPIYCGNVRNNAFEFLYVSDFNPESEYYLRITSADDLPYSNLVNANVKSIYINAEPAEIDINNFDILDENSSFSLIDQSVFDYPMSEVVFAFEEEESGDTFEVSLDFNSSLDYPISLFPELEIGSTYGISAQYRSNLIDVEIPFGPQKTFLYQPAIALAPEFTVFPNPTENGRSTINLRFSHLESGEGMMRLHDLTGRMIFSQFIKINSSVLTLSSLPDLSAGTYVLSFVEGDKKTAQQLLFVH
jgi:hypothetical protein